MPYLLRPDLTFCLRAAFLVALGAAAWVADVTVVLAEANDKKETSQFTTVSGQILLLLGALLGAGGGLRYFLEPHPRLLAEDTGY